MDRFSFNFKDKTCFVTGASSGIGRSTALAFGRHGGRVVCVDVNQGGGIETAEMINKSGGQSLFVKCDVSSPKEVESAIKKTIETYGSLDVAFNNAGIEGTAAPVAEATEENWDRIMNINLKGTWLCMKTQIAQMLKQGHGVIVNCSSIAGIVGFQGSSAYVASKHGVIGLTKTAALEYAKSNIRVNAVCPGIIHTAMIDRYTKGNEQVLAQFAAGAPVGRVGVPDEIASAVLWLCSEGSSYVTGQTLTIDGGWVVQ